MSRGEATLPIETGCLIPTRSASLSGRSAYYPTKRFWDTLSKIHLTPRALEEFDRRLYKLQRQTSLQKGKETYLQSTLPTNNLKRFARRGGPGLTHLRGFASRAIAAEMNPPPLPQRHKRPSQSIGSPSTPKPRMSNVNHMTVSTSAQHTGDTGTPGKSGPYDNNFRQKLIDNGAYPEDHEYADGTFHPRPANMDEIQNRLQNRRASLDPSRFTDQHFEAFRRKNNRAVGNENTVISAMRQVIVGDTDDKYRPLSSVRMNNLEPFEEGMKIPAPDLYDGVQPEIIPRQIRRDLAHHIIPCTQDSRPAVPNFFEEWKSHQGRADVALLEACHDGAAGARAIHKLKNYGKAEAEEEYDNLANSFSVIYHPSPGTLVLYSHHLTAPKVAGGKPEYHMTRLRSFVIIDTTASFREGAAAYRNMRDLAAETRVDAVAQAKTMAA